LVAPASAVQADGDATCAVTVSGEVACWGENDAGQLGSPASAEPLSAPTLIPGLSHVVELVMGVPSCALDDTGDVHCWGDGCPLLSRSDKPVKIEWVLPPGPR
jgi:hypothetical protein